MRQCDNVPEVRAGIATENSAAAAEKQIATIDIIRHPAWLLKCEPCDLRRPDEVRGDLGTRVRPTDHSDLRTAEWFGAGVGRRMPLASAKSAGIVGHEGRGPRACGSDNVFRRELTGGRTEVEHPFLMGHAVDMHWAPDRKVVAFQKVDDMACRRVSRVVRHGPAGQIGEFCGGEKRQ